MAERTNINRHWRFLASDPEDAEGVGFDDSGWQLVNLPHSNKLLPHHAFDDAEYQFISWYRKQVAIPDSARAGRAFLDFDGVMTACEVYVNGEPLGEHKGGYTPFSVDLTGRVEPAKAALVALRVDSTERQDIPPFGGVVDYLTFGGIHRDVFLRTCGRSYIRDVFAKGIDVLTSPCLEADIEVEEPSEGQSLTLTLKDSAGATIAESSASVRGNATQMRLENLGNLRLWSLDAPYLYGVELTLKDPDGAPLDSHSFRFGFREARFCKDGAFRLNGQVVKLMGLDRHQTYPYLGGAAPARLQRRDADILKFELAVNIVRTSHYPQSPHFLDRCDEVGLLVFEEIPGWQYLGDEAWKEVSKQNVREMILRDRNHPCIVLWGVRINESLDDHDFYSETNRIAHELDPTRQTGGVRYFLDSEFLEDVFTYNDFSKGVVDPKHLPHLITEFNGHMFPTKTWDCEERRVEHALRHAKIQSLQMLDERISGAIGWCAFDYNTHSIFGSGDRICYHGVCDIFRLPKWAAYAYASQADPQKRIVLEVASTYTMGDRAEAGVEPLVIFSNCDRLRVYVGEEFRGEFFPAVRDYPGLPHPPFIITKLGELWGDKWRDLTVEGYLADRKVAEVKRACDPLPAALKVWADSCELLADGQDMTSLNFQIVDKYGHVCPYTSEIVTLEAEGPVDIIGANPFPPQGGQGAVYLKAKDTPGAALIKASTPRLAPSALEIRLRK